VHAAPGGPLTVYLSNPNVRPEDIARLERLLGLDRPLHEQYLGWLSAFATGDWGFSYVDGRPVLERVLERAGGTLELMGSAFGLALVSALVLGSLAALRPGSAFDSLVSGASIVGISLPTFWLARSPARFAVELRLLLTAGRMGRRGEGRLAHLFFRRRPWRRSTRPPGSAIPRVSERRCPATSCARVGARGLSERELSSATRFQTRSSP
jgi:peptide/nickel transport system permease protein